MLKYPVQGTTLKYGSTRGSRQQDTLVFVDDPGLAWAAGAGSELPPYTSQGVGLSWSGCGSVGCDDTRDVARTLTCNDFHPFLECSADVVTEAYYTYDRGACSKRVDTRELLQELVSEATQTMYDKVEDGDPGLAYTESDQTAQAQTGIWQAPESTQARGGLQLNLKLDVHTTGITSRCWYCWPLVINYDANASASARYEWGLSDGILSLSPLRIDLLEDDNDTDIYVLFDYDQPLGDELVDALGGSVPDEVHSKAADVQTVEIPDTDEQPWACESAADCTNPLEGPGAALSLAIAFSGLPPDTRAALKALIQQPDEWLCEETCKMRVRAKRVNVYPGAVELVFRDAGAYPITRETAIELALRLTGNTSAMCDAPNHGQRLSAGFVHESKTRTYD